MNLLKSRDRLYIIAVCTIFLFLFIWCPMSCLLYKTGFLDIKDMKNTPKSPEKVYESGIFAGILNIIEEGKAGLDSLYTNYLPMYGEIVTLLKSSDTDMQMSFVDLLGAFAKSPDISRISDIPDIPETTDISNYNQSDIIISGGEDNGKNIENKTEPATDTADKIEFSTIMLVDDGLHRYYAIRPFDFIDTALSFPEDILRANMNEQIGEINRLIDAAADLNADFYLYVGKRMQDAEYFSDIIPAEISTAPMFREFMSRIDGAKGKGALDVDTLERRLENIFRTDHHWSPRGAYGGYVDIISMINKVSPEIGEPLALNGIITYDDVDMRGSASRISSFPRFTEKFGVMDVDLPPQDRKYRVTDKAGEYSSGKFDKSMYADHYAAYYNYSHRYIYPENNTGRRLLLIGDSFTWGSAWLIAANFDETYIFFPWDRKKLDYGDFISKNGITDVLLMQFSDRIIFNIYNDCPLKNIRTQ